MERSDAFDRDQEDVVSHAADTANTYVGKAKDVLQDASNRANKQVNQTTEKVSHQVAGKVDLTADYLKQHNTNEVVRDASGYLKQHPGRAIVGAALAGFVIGRVLR